MTPTPTRRRAVRQTPLLGGLAVLGVAALLGAAPAHAAAVPAAPVPVPAAPVPAAPVPAEGGTTDPSVAVSVPAAQPRTTYTPPPATSTTPPATPAGTGGTGGKKSGATPAADPAPTAAPATEPTIPDSPGTGDPAAVDKELYRAGGSVTVTASGFTAAEQVQLVLYSEPVLIGNFTAGPDGAVSITFTLPEDLRPGTHTVRLAGWSSSHVAVAELLVGTPAGAVVAADGGVPTWVWWVGGALGLAGAGYGGVRVVRAMRAAPTGATVEVVA
jgi:hypothetical protein